MLVSKAVCPGMVARGEGVLGITGATASLRGKPFTTAFASSKVYTLSLEKLLQVYISLYKISLSIVVYKYIN